MKAQDFLVLAERRLVYGCHFECKVGSTSMRSTKVLQKQEYLVKISERKQTSVMVLKKREASLQRQGLARC